MEKLGLHKGGAGEGVEEVPFGASKTLGHLGHNISWTLFSVMTTLPMDARDQCSPPLRCLSHLLPGGIHHHSHTVVKHQPSSRG